MRQHDTIGIGDFALPFDYAELILTFAADLGLSTEKLLDGTGLTIRDLMSAPRFIRNDSYSSFVDNLCAAADNNQTLPWRYGRILSFHPHGMFGMALRSARSLRDAYADLPEFFSTRSGGSQIVETRNRPDGFDILVRSGNPGTSEQAVWFHTISSLVNLAWIGRSITGSLDTDIVNEIHIAWPEPPGSIPKDLVPLGTILVFDQRQSFLRHPAAQMRLPIISSGAALNSAAQSRITLEMASPPKELEAIGQVKWAIRKLGLTNSSVNQVSARLHVSPATLKRRLKMEGTTFLEIKNIERFSLVCARLEKTDQSLEAIAYDVGYDNPSNLSKAFKKRYGMSPGDYREKRAANG